MANTSSQQTKTDLARALHRLEFVKGISNESMQSRVSYLKRPDVDAAFQAFFKAVCAGHFEIDDSNVNGFKTIFLAETLSENDSCHVISGGVKEYFLEFKKNAVDARLRAIALYTCINKRGESNVKPKLTEMFHSSVDNAMASFKRMTEVKHTILRLKYATLIKKGLEQLSKTRWAARPMGVERSEKDLETLCIRNNMAKNMKILVRMYEEKGGSSEDFPAWQREVLGRTLEEEIAADAA
jgi:hypothetical protein